MAFRVLDGDVREQESITYSALRHRATERARALVRNGAAGRNVVLFQPTGLDFVVSFFAVLATGGTVIPLNPRLLLRPADGLDGIVANARPALLLGDRTTAARLARAGYDNNALGLPVTDPTEYCTDQDTDTEMVPAAEPSAIAVIQYTSGSTSAPKGACITHANFLNNARLLTETFEAGPGDSTVSWLPLFHDMGLMTSVVWPVVTGATSVLLRPSTFAVNPASWLIALSKYGGTVSSAPNFAYQLCVDRIGGEDIANLNLSGWRVAICGAEPVRAETVERFVERFSAAGFARRSLFPSYGLAEATLFVSGGPRRNGPAILIVDAEAIEQQGLVRSPSSGVTTRRLVSCGAVGAGLEVLIMDAAGGELAEGEVGEIWLRGNSIGAGYLGQDALNAEVFRATPDPAYAPRTSGVGTFLRTGDLGFLADLFVVHVRRDADHSQPCQVIRAAQSDAATRVTLEWRGSDIRYPPGRLARGCLILIFANACHKGANVRSGPLALASPFEEAV